MADAAALDEAIAKGGNPGPLAGIPLAVKDNHDAVGFRTTHGAPVLADAPLATADSPFVARLRAAGCIVVGKTNMPEFAWSSNTTNALFGPTANPFNTDARARRVVGRIGGGARRGHGALGHGVGRRRLDTPPVGLLRALGDEAVARPGSRRRPARRRAGSTCPRAGRWHAASSTS